MKNKAIGSYGELLALKYLKKCKYKILETNFTTKIGEIDIIAILKDTIVFIEVKTRTTNAFGAGREAVHSHKQNKIRNVAVQYLKIKNLIDAKIRFDVIEVEGENITHFENAF